MGVGGWLLIRSRLVRAWVTSGRLTWEPLNVKGNKRSSLSRDMPGAKTKSNQLSSGIALAEKIQSSDADALTAYFGMLKGGSSKPPLELLKGGGVDLTKPEAVEAAARLMDRTLSEMERLLDAG